MVKEIASHSKNEEWSKSYQDVYCDRNNVLKLLLV